MLIATFGPTTGWAGKAITREGEVFTLEGHGPITAADVMEYDQQGHLQWATPGTRAWVGSKARPAEARSLPVASATSSPGARGRLDKAREQCAKGKYSAAVDTLWRVEADARIGDRQAAQGILELLPLLRDKTRGAARKECDALFERVSPLFDAQMQVRARVGPLAVSFWPAWFLGYQGSPHPALVHCGEGILWFASEWIGMGTPEGRPSTEESVPVGAIASVGVSGGRVMKGSRELFVNYAMAGLPGLVLLGMRTDRTTVVLHTTSGNAAVFQVEDQDASAVQAAVTPLLQSAVIPFWNGTPVEPPAATAPPSGLTETDHANAEPSVSTSATTATPGDSMATSVADEIVKLADLRRKGMLTDEEFAAFKAKLME